MRPNGREARRDVTGYTEVNQPPQATHRWAYVEMLLSSLLGLVASLVLSADAVVLAANPNAALSCNLTAKISCGAVGVAWQSSLLGFPNAFLGLIAEPVVITIAVAGLGGVRFPRWFIYRGPGCLLDRAGVCLLAVLPGLLRDRSLPVVSADHGHHDPGLLLHDSDQHPGGHLGAYLQKRRIPSG